LRDVERAAPQDYQTRVKAELQTGARKTHQKTESQPGSPPF
jgi:hypothetical protein